MGKRCRGRLVHGQIGGRGHGRGGSSGGTKSKLTRRAGKRGRTHRGFACPDDRELTGIIDCLIATLPGDRPNNRRGRGNGGGGGRDGRPRSGARGGRPLSRDTAKPEGWVPAQRNILSSTSSCNLSSTCRVHMPYVQAAKILN